MRKNWLRAQLVLALWFWAWLLAAWLTGRWEFLFVGIPPYVVLFYLREGTSLYDRFYRVERRLREYQKKNEK